MPPQRHYTARFGVLRGQLQQIEEDEGGFENCREEDEERRDAELVERSLSRMVLKDSPPSDSRVAVEGSEDRVHLGFGNPLELGRDGRQS